MRLLVLCLLVAFAWKSARAQSCKITCTSNKPGDSSFDYFKLVRQWPLSFCDQGCRITPPDGVSFTLHGLWPERTRPVDGKYWPECCNPAAGFNPDSIKPLLKELEKNWPSWKQPNNCFWKHEYDKHGTCASGVISGGESGYFQTTLHLHKQYNIENALAKVGIEPKNDKYIDTATLLAALKAAFGKSSTISCSNGMLQEVTTCFSKSGLQLIDCPTGGPRCSAKALELPAGPYDFKNKWGDE